MNKTITLLFIAGTLLCTSVSGRAATIYAFAGTGTSGNTGNNGQATSANIFQPYSCTSDPFGNFYFIDLGNRQVRKIAANGTISLFAGNGTQGNTGNGGAATAANFQAMGGIASDASGNIYISDETAHCIRKINTSGVISQFAGSTTATSGSTGDGGQATSALLNDPTGMCFDGSGNMYVCDAGNHKIRKITPAGVITIVCGNGTDGNAGNGGAATSATISMPWSIGCDGAGNVYFLDGNYFVVRKFTPGGNINAFAGTSGSYSYGGDGGQATSASGGFMAIAVDASGNVYLADDMNYRIRKVYAATGIITTIAGNGTPSVTGDGGPASSATLKDPYQISIDANNNLYVSEYGANVIRRIQGSPLPVKLTSFAVKLVNNEMVAVNWAAPASGYGFTIERSGDGVTFTPISHVNTNPANEYTFYDNGPLQGKSYYRLRIDDFDGKGYSQIGQVFISSSTYTHLYPSLANSYFVIESNDAGLRSVVISNTEGKWVRTIGVTSGNRIDISDLVPGGYLVTVNNGQSFKLVKQ